MRDYPDELAALGFDVDPAAPLAIEADVRALEESVGATLPPEYRQFLLSVGENWGCVLSPHRETTPRGDEHQILSFYSLKDINGFLDSMITPRNMLTIGYGDFAAYTSLSICGIDRGCVYAIDGEWRAYMEDDEFWQQYPQMAESIQEYLRVRAAGELPDKPIGYENVYLLAESFDAFLDSLKPCSEESEDHAES